jgi:late competence protein required for DNA uptake (superfamily II DNA/RNA helicase)
MTWVRCARCGQRKHRHAVVHSRFTGNYYCFDRVALERCEAIVKREREWLEATFADSEQGALIV